MNSNEIRGDAHAVVDSALQTDPNRVVAIQEGKDKAKAIMAASSLDINSVPDTTENGELNTSLSSSSTEIAVNGESPSRKRSRSGSRIRLPDSRGAYPVETDTDRYLLLRAIERDTDYASKMYEEMEWFKQLVIIKRDERAQWESYTLPRKEELAVGLHGESMLIVPR
jgi:hypothetical protein